MAAAPQKDLESESLREAMERNPAELDDASTSPPCGEMTKRSPGAPQPAYDPIHSMVDMDTAGMAQRTLPEALAEAGPALPDEQSATPYHTTDKEGVHDLTKLASKG